MSNKVSEIVLSRRVGSVHRKAVLAYMAGRCSDDGTGIWCSKQTIANETECGRSTVIKICNEFVSEGLLAVTGERSCRSGSTVEYRINLAALRSLPSSSDAFKPSTSGTPCPPAGLVHQRDPSTSGTGGVHQRDPKPSTSGTQTILEPSFNHPLPPIVPQGDFDAFWAVVPRKKGKGAARKAFAKALRKTDEGEIVSAMMRYAEERAGKDPRFTAHPSTWLNEERWHDEPDPSQQDFHNQVSQALGGSNDQLRRPDQINHIPDQPRLAALAAPGSPDERSGPDSSAGHGRSGERAYLRLTASQRN